MSLLMSLLSTEGVEMETMSVKELRDVLAELPDDAVIHVEGDSAAFTVESWDFYRHGDEGPTLTLHTGGEV
jgi:hypothetical protein